MAGGEGVGGNGNKHSQAVNKGVLVGSDAWAGSPTGPRQKATFSTGGGSYGVIGAECPQVVNDEATSPWDSLSETRFSL